MNKIKHAVSLLGNTYFKVIYFILFVGISYAWICIKLNDLHMLFDFIDKELCQLRREIQIKK